MACSNFTRGLLIPLLLSLHLLAQRAFAASGDAPRSLPQCAFVAKGDSSLASLIEAKLLDRVPGTWLERNEIEAVLAEQDLAATFAASSAGPRIALGRLLKADLLVLLRETGPRIDLVVTETEGGLRLLAHSMPRSEDTEADADRLVDLAHEGIAKYRESVREVYAVPPFLSRDLGSRENHLMGAYAKLVERVLLAQPGVVVVETEEADALAKEYARAETEDRLRRRLPIYVWGEYRHDGRDDTRRVTIRLEVKRGETVLKSTSQAMAPEEAATFLEQATVELIGKHDAESTFGVETEARELTRRSGEFLKLREWQQALTLAELSVLLVPDQVDAHVCAIIAIGQLRRRLSGREYRRWQPRSFHHLKQALDSEDHDRVAVATIETAMSRWRLSSIKAARRSPEAARQLEIEREYALQKAYDFAERGVWDKSCELLLRAGVRMPLKQEVDARLAFLSKYQHKMDRSAKWQLVRNSYATPREEIVRLWRTILDWEEVDEELVFCIRAKQRHVENALAAVTRKANEDSNKTLPRTQTASTSLSFRPLKIDPPTELPAQHNCLRLDDGSDVFWGWDEPIIHVAESGRAKVLYQPERIALNIASHMVVSDGRYLWVCSFHALVRKCWLRVVDPQSGRVYLITKKHGLPSPEMPESDPNRPILRAAPLGYGEAIVAAYYGDTWIAHVRFSPDGNHHVHVFHEAKEIHTHQHVAPLGDDRDDTYRNPRIAFRPASMGTWTDSQSGDERVVIVRSLPDVNCYAFLDHPLTVDPQDLSISVMQQQLPHTLRSAAKPVSQIFIEKANGQGTLKRFDHPDRPATCLLASIPLGEIVVDGDTVHVVGEEWRQVNLQDLSWRSFGATPWLPNRLSRGDAFRFQSVYASNLYGMVVVLRKGKSSSLYMAQVLFDGSGVSFDELTTAW